MSLQRVAVAATTFVLASCAGLPQGGAGQYEATITRTTFGIAHVKAADYGGLGFGAAYARAQDNVCLLADSYLSYAGERSRNLGAAGDTLLGLKPAKNLESDLFYLGVVDLASLRAQFARTSPEFRALVDGWVAGYNRYLLDHAGKLPAPCGGQPWVRAISADDVLRSANAFSILASSAVFGAQIVNAAPPAAEVVKAASIAEVETPEPLGSNGWAFGADATSNGKGLVIGNPHFPWVGSNRFYQVHLTIPGQLDVAGAAILTLPFVGVGFNRDVAWSHTVDTAAHMTLHRLALDPADPTAYIVDGKRERMTARTLAVQDKDGSAITRTLYATRFGPVVSVPGSKLAWTNSVAYAVADANNGNVRSGDTWLDIGRSRSVHDVRAALVKHRGAPFINTLAADRGGDAMYADITAVPNVSAQKLADCGAMEARMPGHWQELVLLDGSRSACAVDGLLPADQTPTLVRRDFVQNSNDTYRWTHPDAVMNLGPLLGHDPGMGSLRTRAAITEIRKVLANGKFDPDLAVRTILSNKVPAADLVLAPTLKLCKRKGALPAAKDACAALAKWDGKAEVTSRGALLANQYWLKASALPGIWDKPYDPNDIPNTPRGLKTDGANGEALLAALAASAQGLKDLGIAIDATLGETQFSTRGTERIPVSGLQDGGTLNLMRGRPAKGGFEVIHGSSYIQAVTFDEQGPVAKSRLTYSQSTDPASPNHGDQTREFSKDPRVLSPYPFTDAEIAADAIGTPLIVGAGHARDPARN